MLRTFLINVFVGCLGFLWVFVGWFWVFGVFCWFVFVCVWLWWFGMGVSSWFVFWVLFWLGFVWVGVFGCGCGLLIQRLGCCYVGWRVFEHEGFLVKESFTKSLSDSKKQRWLQKTLGEHCSSQRTVCSSKELIKVNGVHLLVKKS